MPYSRAHQGGSRERPHRVLPTQQYTFTASLALAPRHSRYCRITDRGWSRYQCRNSYPCRAWIPVGERQEESRDPNTNPRLPKQGPKHIPYYYYIPRSRRLGYDTERLRVRHHTTPLLLRLHRCAVACVPQAVQGSRTQHQPIDGHEPPAPAWSSAVLTALDEQQR